jgi:peptidoglycan/xylan/chitin deacetylase (PgdA/CDA1 family)
MRQIIANDRAGSMPNMRHNLIRVALEALYFSGAHVLLGPLCRGVGAVLMLHHVRPPRFEKFQPNRMLEIVPGFLESVIGILRDADIDLVSLDEMHRRLTERDFRRRFACVTLYDGYRDNKDWAYPIFRRHGVPFAIYVPSSFPDRLGKLWWLMLEQAIANTKTLAFMHEGEVRRFSCASVAEKREAFSRLYWWLRERPTNEEIVAIVAELGRRYGVDADAVCEEHCMTWDELAELARDPLVTIGAHTVNHVILAKTSDAAAKSEIKMGRAVVQAVLGEMPKHFAYPFGDASTAGPREFAAARDAGYKTAVTTRPGVLFAEHADHLMALPRLSINGEFQRERYVQVLLSGAGTGVWNGFRRVSAA